MENTEQILRREQDRKMLETIFKTIENQKVNVDTSQCSNALVLSNSESDESKNTIFNSKTTFGKALQIFNLTLDENLISNIRKKKLQYHPDKNNGDIKDIDKFYALEILSNKAQIIKRYGHSEFATFLTMPLKDISENHSRYIYIYYLKQIDFFGKMELETIFKNTKLLSTKDIEDEFEKQDLELEKLAKEYEDLFKKIENLQRNQNLDQADSVIKELKNTKTDKTKIENIKKFIEEIEKFNDKLIKQVITINKISILNEYFFQISNKKLFPENLNDLNFTEKDSIYMDGLLEYKKLIESNDENIKIYKLFINFEEKTKYINLEKLETKKRQNNNLEHSEHSNSWTERFIKFVGLKFILDLIKERFDKNNYSHTSQATKNTSQYNVDQFSLYAYVFEPQSKITHQEKKEKKIDAPAAEKINETNKKKEIKISFKEHTNNINYIKINDALQGQHNIIYALDITIDNLTNTLQQQVQKANEAQAEKEQERARTARVLKRNSKGDELEDMGQRAQGRLLRRHNSITATLEQSQEIESIVRLYFPDEILTLLNIQSNRANAPSL